ncbi:PucR family transcriptional regulator [Agromyces bauzanensis]
MALRQDQDPLQRLCAELESRLPQISAVMVERVRSEIPSYSQVPIEEHRRSVTGATRELLITIASETGPTAAQMQRIQQVSRQRAYYGIPVQDVLAAFHVVVRDLWDEIRSASGSDDAVAIRLVQPIWRWVQDMSTRVADEYATEAGTRQGEEVALRQRLLELLRSGDAADEQTSETARRLGFLTDGVFQAFCAPAEAWLHGQLALLERSVKQSAGVVHSALHGQLMIVLAQNVEEEAILGRIAKLGGKEHPVGAGLPRRGLSGAESSIVDAERALQLAPGSGGTRRFEDVWLRASLLDSRERLQPLLAPALSAAISHPALVDTIVAFARSENNLAVAGEQLHVHANTVAYRLNRWEEVSGLNVRSFEGMLRSMLAIGFTRSDSGPDL